MRQKAKAPIFTKEVDLCSAFLVALKSHNEAVTVSKNRSYDAHIWTPYAETAGWDILLVSDHDGTQIGIEAKLKLNSEVLAQCLPEGWYSDASTGPDFRSILVPEGQTQANIGLFAQRFGISVISQNDPKKDGYRSFYPELPKIGPPGYNINEWVDWLPNHRCQLPEYVPDVIAGDAAPLQLSQWKIQALKICCILKSRPVQRSDFRELKINSTRWLDRHLGWLVATTEGYVASKQMPDLISQHPTIFEQVCADQEKWMPKNVPLAKQKQLALDIISGGNK
jgi:hypothetical protein